MKRKRKSLEVMKTELILLSKSMKEEFDKTGRTAVGQASVHLDNAIKLIEKSISLDKKKNNNLDEEEEDEDEYI